MSLLALLLAVVGFGVYANSFSGVFLFDDEAHIVKNEKLAQLWPIGDLLRTRRPVLNITLAANRAIHELDTWGYHLVNVAVHVLASLTLFGLVRRTLRTPRMRDRFARDADSLAFVCALLWMIHPLQTQSVTYIVQRGEALMGLFYLLMLYCIVRGETVERSWVWYFGAVIACTLGMGSKAVMVTAPVVALFFDRSFLTSKSPSEMLRRAEPQSSARATPSGATQWQSRARPCSFRTAIRRRWPVYLGLVATWGVLFALGIVQGTFHSAPNPAANVGLSYTGVTPWEYAVTQPGVILHYLRLVFWPTGQCLDYNWGVAEGAMEVVPSLLILSASVLASMWGLLRGKPSGFLGVAFFLILAPTSSVIPIKDLSFEHRMYLPLAACVVLVVIGGYGLLRLVGNGLGASRRIVFALSTLAVAAVALPLAGATVVRNRVYRSEEAMWRDVVAKRPENYRSHLGLGAALHKQGHIDEAIELYRRALNIKPAYSDGWYNLAAALEARGQTDESAAAFSKAIELTPRRWEAYRALGRLLSRAGRYGEAAEVYRRAIALKSRNPAWHYALGNVLSDAGDWRSAVDAFGRAVELDTGHTDAWINLGNAHLRLRAIEAAKNAYRRAAELDPSSVVALANLGSVLAQQGKLDEAVDALEEAVRLKPDLVPARLSLGLALKRQGRGDDAVEAFRAVLVLDPGNAAARRALDSLERDASADEK